MPRNKFIRTVALRDRNDEFIRWVGRREAFQLLNDDKAEWIDPVDPRKGMRIAKVQEAMSGQGLVLESLAIEKFPQIVSGGLTRTETQPRINKHIPRLRQWFAAASQ